MILLNGIPVKINKFPNGETLIKTEDLTIDLENIVTVKFEDDSDLMNMIFIASHIKESNKKAVLHIPYMPYSRMDRTEGQTVFTLKYICRIINSLNFDKVLINEPHSDVCVALLDRVEVVNSTAEITTKFLDIIYRKEPNSNIYIVYPDGGATKRYGKQISHDKVLTCTKDRDFSTGYIKQLTINGEVPTEPFVAIIIDDLSSKGGTFMLTAQKLRELGATEIILIVTHCEKTIFCGDIFATDVINKVITTNSILDENDEIVQDAINKGRLDILQLL